MIAQNKFLKNILTTASTLAIVMGVTTDACAAAAAHDINGNVNVSSITAGNWANFNNINSNLTFDAVGQSLAGATSPTGASTTLIAANTGASVGAIQGTSPLTIRVNNGKDLTLTGVAFSTVSANDYSGVGAMNIGNGSATSTTLTVNMASGHATFTNTFDASWNNTGANLIVTNDGNIFGGNIGTNYKIGNFNINGNTTIGGTGTALTSVASNATAIANNKTLTINSTANAITWTGAINGSADNVGGLVLTAASAGNSKSITMNSLIGQVHPLSSLTISMPSTSATSGGFPPTTTYATVYLNNHVTVNGNIDMSGAGAIVNAGTITLTSLNGNILTGAGTHSSSSQSGTTMSGTTVIIPNGQLILGGNLRLGSAPTITASQGIVMNGYTITTPGGGGPTINADLIGTNGGGTLSLGQSTTLAGSAGSAADPLTLITFVNNQLELNIDATAAPRSIYAPITAGTTTVNVTGGNVTFFMDTSLKFLHFVTDHTIGFDSTLGNISVTAPITTYAAGKGTLATSGANTVTFNSDIGNGTALAAININANTTLYSSVVNATAINIASGKTLTIDSTAGTRSITGTIDGAADNVGTLVFTRGTNAITINSNIGTTHPLSLVRFSNFNGGSPGVLSHDVRATTLDLIGTSIVGLDSNTTNITNFTSTGGNGYVYYNGAGSLTVKNIAIPLTLHSTGTLTASNATGGVAFNGNAGNTPTFIAANNASISDVTVLGVSGVGTFRTAGNATFTGSIGSSTYSLAALTLTGTSGQIVAINNATDIYASSITHSDVTLDAHVHDVTMHGNYSAHDVALTLGTKSITLSPGTTAILAGTLVINASYTGTGQTVLDLSGATSLDASTLTALTLNINNGTVIPVSNDVMNVIKVPVALGSVMLPTNMTVSMGTSDVKWKHTSFGVLTYDPPVSSSPPITSANITVAGGVSAVGASSSDIKQALLKLGGAAQINANGVATFKTTELDTRLRPDDVTPISPQSQSTRSKQILSLPSISNLNVLDTTVPAGSGTTKVNSSVAAYAGQFDTQELKNGWVGTASNTITQNKDLELDPSFTQAFGVIASGAGLIPDTMANAIINPEDGGTSTELVDTMVRVAATDGPAIAKEMVDRISAGGNGSSVTALNNIQTRQSTQLLPPQTIISSGPSTIVISPSPSTTIIAPPQGPAVLGVPSSSAVIPSSVQPETPPVRISRPLVTSDEDVGVPADDLQAVAYGIAAGDSPYDKYGVWMSLNAGKATQKAMKGNAGFKSHSEGFALGVDTMINERTSVGITVSNTQNHVKHRDQIIGNKTDSSSWVGAIYGNRQLKNDWFIRGAALFNRTRMNDKELRRVQGGYGIAQAKYNLISYGGEASVGFAHRFKNELILTPSIGFRVLHNNKLSYGQEGDTYQNNKSSTNAMDNYSALAGLSLSKSFMKYDISIVPEAHVNVQYGVNQKTPTGTFVSALTPNQTTNFIGSKADKIVSTYGVSLTGSTDKFECGIAGDVSIATKYVGYQGSLKLKVKF